MSQPSFPSLCAVLLLVLSVPAPSCGAEVEPRSNKPNILFILADDVGTEALGCYGGTSYPTPSLDALAESGIRFENCYVMPVCHPTRVALLSGRYPFQLGNPDWGTYPKEAEEETFPNLLQDAGYATAIAGKWQLTLLRDDLQQPFRMGFDEYCLFGWHEGPRYYSPLIYENGVRREGLEGAFGPDIYTDFLIDFMKRNRTKPFFAFYSMAVCHDVTNDLDAPVPFAPHGRYDSFAQLVEIMDRMIRKMVTAVEDIGLLENTLIIYASDNGTKPKSLVDFQNGEYIYEPVVSKLGDREIPGGKGKLTNWGTRVPLLASWKGKIEPGRTTNALVDSVDFFQTFTELAEAEVPADAPYYGRSFKPVLEGGSAMGRDWAFAQGREGYWVRTLDWKLYGDGRLFLMKEDPEETRPLDAEIPSSPEANRARKELQAVLDSLHVRL